LKQTAWWITGGQLKSFAKTSRLRCFGCIQRPKKSALIIENQRRISVAGLLGQK